MSKDTMPGTTQPEITVGFDIGDRYSQLCLLDHAGEILEESRLPTTLPATNADVQSRRQHAICSDVWIPIASKSWRLWTTLPFPSTTIWRSGTCG